MLVNTQKDILSDLPGIFTMPDDLIGQSPDSAFVSDHQFIKGLLLATERTLDQIGRCCLRPGPSRYASGLCGVGIIE